MAVLIISCNTGSKTKISDGVKEKTQDTVFNEKIQGVFFDTPFGASKEDVIKNFEGSWLELYKIHKYRNVTTFWTQKR